MWGITRNRKRHFGPATVRAYNAGKVVALLRHVTCTRLRARLSVGRLITSRQADSGVETAKCVSEALGRRAAPRGGASQSSRLSVRKGQRTWSTEREAVDVAARARGKVMRTVSSSTYPSGRSEVHTG